MPIRASRALWLVLLLCAAMPALAQDRSASTGKAGRPAKAAIPLVQPEEKREIPLPAGGSNAAPGPAPDAAGLFEEIEFGGTLVIEGKVEKPQVQFTLLKEPPPAKDVRFEASFLENILEQERENTFRP